VIPVGAVEGGYSEDQCREKLYVGRAFYKGHLIPGKIQTTHKAIYIPYETMEVPVKKYEILVSPHQNLRCANKILYPPVDVDHPPDSDSDDDRRMIEEAEDFDNDEHDEIIDEMIAF
jgi:hypothetical protein